MKKKLTSNEIAMTIKMKENQYKELLKIKQKHGISMADLVRISIADFLKNRAK